MLLRRYHKVQQPKGGDNEVSIDLQQSKPLVECTLKELRELCKARGLKGYSNKSEEELIAMLMDGEG